MRPRFCLSFAAALMLGAPLTVTAAPLQASNGPIPLPPDLALGGATSAQSYDQPSMGDDQSFGLVAMQMLGAAAACEQMDAARMSLDTPPQIKANGDVYNHGDLDAAQQHFLNPTAIAGNPSKKGGADCDRLAGSFDQLQQIQLRNQSLSRDLDQPDGLISPNPNRPR